MQQFPALCNDYPEAIAKNADLFHNGETF